MGIMFGGGTSRVVEIHGLTGCLDFKWLMWTLLYHVFTWVQLPVLLADLACTWSLGICLRGDGWRVVCRLWLWKLKEWRSFMNWWPTCSLPGVVCMWIWDFCLNSGLEHRQTYSPLSKRNTSSVILCLKSLLCLLILKVVTRQYFI